jgi:hypothetical protein
MCLDNDNLLIWQKRYCPFHLSILLQVNLVPSFVKSQLYYTRSTINCLDLSPAVRFSCCGRQDTTYIMQYHYKLFLCESSAAAIRILARGNRLTQLILPHPPFDGIGGVLVLIHTSQQCLRSFSQAEHFDVLRKNKAFLFGMQYHCHQRLEVIAHV